MKKINHKELHEEIHEEIEEIKEKREEAGKEALHIHMTIKQIVRQMFSLKFDVASPEVIDERFVSGGIVTGPNLSILVLAILIASIGLNVNSTAVIIGAMLISPLMGTIHSAAYGTATVDMDLIKRSVVGFFFQVFMSLVTSTIYFAITPLKTATSELLARTQPTAWDVLIAICGGLAGVIGLTRKEKSNVIPGVAIATALMPPLCTCGYAIANGEWRMLLGAGYLFSVNTYFIFLSAAIILVVLEVPRVGTIAPKVWKRLKSSVIRNTILIVIPSIVIGALVVSNTKTEDINKNNLTDSISTEMVYKQVKILYPTVVDFKIGNMSDYKTDDKSRVEAIIITTKGELPNKDKEILEKWLDELYGQECYFVYNVQ